MTEKPKTYCRMLFDKGGRQRREQAEEVEEEEEDEEGEEVC